MSSGHYHSSFRKAEERPRERTHFRYVNGAHSACFPQGLLVLVLPALFLSPDLGLLCKELFRRGLEKCLSALRYLLQRNYHFCFYLYSPLTLNLPSESRTARLPAAPVVGLLKNLRQVLYQKSALNSWKRKHILSYKH